MNLGLAVRREQEFINKITDIYRAAATYASPHTELLGRLKSVYATDEFDRCPQWVKHAVKVHDQCMLHSLYACGLTSHHEAKRLPPLAWMLIGPDGKKYYEKDNSWLQESAYYKADMQGVHIWRDRWEIAKEFKPFGDVPSVYFLHVDKKETK